MWLTETERPTPTGQKQRIFRRRFIALFGGNKDKQGLAVIEEGKDGSLLWTFVPTKQLAEFARTIKGKMIITLIG